jgi:DNA polymerase-3 subunit delta
MATSFEELSKALKAKKFAPIYLLHGEESFYLDRAVEEFEERVVSAAEKSFNQFVLYGKDTDLVTVLGYARRFPFMAERQLVLVKEAQKLGGLDQKDQLARLEEYLKAPSESTVLVLVFQAALDERKAFVKAAMKVGEVLKSPKVYDNKLPEWITKYCHEQGVKISPKATQLLADNIGADLSRLASEIQKVLINLKVGEDIDAGVVEKYVGISKEYNIFELQKALAQRDVLKSNKIAAHFAANPKENPLVVTLISLFGYFTKLIQVHASPDKSERGLATLLGVNPFFVKDYQQGARQYPIPKLAQVIHTIRQADAKLKGVEGAAEAEGELLKELIFVILH